MKRSGLGLAPRRPAKQVEYTPRPRARAAGGSVLAQIDGLGFVAPTRARGPVLKVADRVQQALRDSARDEDCCVRIASACNRDSSTTVWSHWPGLDADRGMGIKALDLCGAYCCSGCHDVIDGRAPLPPGATRTSVLLDWFYGHMRSLVRARQKGVI